MNLSKLLLLSGTVLAATAQITFNQSSSFNSLNLSIPDGDLSGIADTREFTMPGNQITSVEVSFTISGTGSGAVNGDLYAYLSYGGEKAVLLNRPGLRTGSVLGYDDNGFGNVTFADNAAANVHFYRTTLFGNDSTAISGPGNLTGTWAPDGRDVSPLSSGATIAGTTPTAGLSAFNGLNPNGNWTLFIADVSGGGTARLDSWSLNVTAVPEPGDAAIAGGAALVGWAMFRRCRRGKKQAN